MCWREDSETTWIVEYRFRYYHSDDPFDKKDKKSWYRVTITSETDPMKIWETLDKCITRARITSGQTQPIKTSFIEINGNYLKAMGLMETRDWVHSKIEPKETDVFRRARE